MPNTATRLISLIMLLQRRPNQKAAELAQALGCLVSKRARGPADNTRAAGKFSGVGGTSHRKERT